MHGSGGRVDYDRALVQHGNYASRLEEAGFALVSLPPLSAHPDSCFVEDTAVVLGDQVLMTRPGAMSRRGEVNSVATALSEYLTPTFMTEPATLDGGDVMVLGRRVFVGQSNRTNEAGRETLAAFATKQGFSLTTIPVLNALHLKSIVSPASDDVVVLLADTIEPDIFAPAQVILVPHEEASAANVLRANDTVVMPRGCPKTQAQLERIGVSVQTIVVDEFANLDGALTCLSILFEA